MGFYECRDQSTTTQDDEHWEGWEWEGVLNFTYNGKGYQVLKSIQNSHY